MITPTPNKHVWAYKRNSRGEVTVHRASKTTGREFVTVCDRNAGGNYAWLWVQFQTLNPERVFLCKRCWR